MVKYPRKSVLALIAVTSALSAVGTLLFFLARGYLEDRNALLSVKMTATVSMIVLNAAVISLYMHDRGTPFGKPGRSIRDVEGSLKKGRTRLKRRLAELDERAAAQRKKLDAAGKKYKNARGKMEDRVRGGRRLLERLTTEKDRGRLESWLAERKLTGTERKARSLASDMKKTAGKAREAAKSIREAAEEKRRLLEGAGDTASVAAVTHKTRRTAFSVAWFRYRWVLVGSGMSVLLGLIVLTVALRMDSGIDATGFRIALWCLAAALATSTVAVLVTGELVYRRITDTKHGSGRNTQSADGQEGTSAQADSEVAARYGRKASRILFGNGAATPGEVMDKEIRRKYAVAVSEYRTSLRKVYGPSIGLALLILVLSGLAAAALYGLQMTLSGGASEVAAFGCKIAFASSLASFTVLLGLLIALAARSLLPSRIKPPRSRSRFKPFVKSALCWIPPLLVGWLIARRIGSEPAEMFLLMDIVGDTVFILTAIVSFLVRKWMGLLNKAGDNQSHRKEQFQVNYSFKNGWKYEHEVKALLLHLILQHETNFKRLNNHLSDDGLKNVLSALKLSDYRNNIDNPDQIKILFDELILKQQSNEQQGTLKLQPPELSLQLSYQAGDVSKQHIFTILMAVQAAYWYGFLDTNGNIQPRESVVDIKVIFAENTYDTYDKGSPLNTTTKFNFLPGISELSNESGTGNVAFEGDNAKINGIIEPFHWKTTTEEEIVQVIEEKSEAEGRPDIVERTIEKIKVNYEIDLHGYSIDFKIDFSNIIEFIDENFKPDTQNIIKPFNVHGSQVNTTYDDTNRSENVGIYMGLSMIDALYRHAQDTSTKRWFKTTAQELRLLQKEYKKNTRRADYMTGKDGCDIVVEVKGHRDATYNTAFKTMLDGSHQVIDTLEAKKYRNQQGFVTVTARKMKPRSKTDVDYHYFILEGIFKDEG